MDPLKILDLLVAAGKRIASAARARKLPTVDQSRKGMAQDQARQRAEAARGRKS